MPACPQPAPRRPLEPNIARGGSLDADEGLLRRYLEELTDPAWEGRGTPKARAAIARWLAGWCSAMGLEPVPGQRSFLVTPQELDPGALSLIRRVYEEDVRLHDEVSSGLP